MSYILLSFMAVIIWATVNISDKFVLSKWIREPLIPTLIYAISGTLVAIVIFLAKGYASLDNQNIILAILSGGCFLLMAIYYFRAVCIEEISRVVPLFYLSNILIAIFAAIFLGEILSVSKYLGILFIVAGAVLISIKEFKRPKLDKGALYMILAALFLSANYLLNKYVLGHADFWTVFSWNRIGSLIFMVPIAYLFRGNIKAALKKAKPIALGLVSLNEIVNLVGTIFITSATAIGLVTVVTGLAATQPLVLFIFTITLSVLFPKIIKEEINKKIITQKLFAIIITVIGTVLLVI